MALTESYMVPLKTLAPDFSLIDTIDNKKKSLSDLKGEKGTLIIFMCNHCPYVIHLLDKLIETSKQFHEKKVKTIAISSNDIITYPEDGPEKMKQFAILKKFSFPYLFDHSQKTAKSYNAACTPDLYLFDENLLLAYRGRYDSSRLKLNIKLTHKELYFLFNMSPTFISSSFGYFSFWMCHN